MNEQPLSPQEPKKSFWAKLFGGGKKQTETSTAAANITPIPAQATAPPTDLVEPAPVASSTLSADPVGMPASGMIGNEIAGATAAAAVPTNNPGEVPGFADQPVTPVSEPVMQQPGNDVSPVAPLAAIPSTESAMPTNDAPTTEMSSMQNQPIEATPLQDAPPITDPLAASPIESSVTGDAPSTNLQQ